MTLRQTIQAAPAKTNELIDKLANTSNQAIKSRETLFRDLNDQLTLYVELEEQHLIPLLRKKPATKTLASDALKGNKELRALLTELEKAPKDDDSFIAKVTELKKNFQKHVRDERKELLPAVLEALSDEEADELANNIESGIAEAENAKREAKREEARQVKHEAEVAERIVETERAAARAQKEVAREAVDATTRVAETVQRGAETVQEGARRVTEDFAQRAQRATTEAVDALNVYSGSARKAMQDLGVLSSSSNVVAKALTEISSVWIEWAQKTAQSTADVSRQMLESRSPKEVAEVQREFLRNTMHDWMERNTRVLDVAQRTSRQALKPLETRLSESA